MAATPTLGGKTCVSCGKNVDGQKRMKDSAGKYWCYDCGLHDEQRKRGDASGSMGSIANLEVGGGKPAPGGMAQCPSCRQFRPEAQMVKSPRGTKKSGGKICADCYHKPKKGTKPRRGGDGMDPDKRKKLILAAVAIVILGIGGAWANGLLPV